MTIDLARTPAAGRCPARPTPPIGICKEMVSTDGIVVGTMCGRFPDDEPWLVGVTAEEYHRQLVEALEREDETTNESEREEA